MSPEIQFSLESKYTQQEGTIILTGAQALVRLPLDQHLADKARGLNTATFISGYRGSPLGGLDFLLQQNEKILRAHQVIFEPGVNEDLAATAVFGSQLARLMQPRYDGVLGMWYGKGPGVDRTGDIFKHAQIAGIGPNGGVLALAGDDPVAKSSTIPSHSEVALYDAQMPVLYPGNVQEVIDMGRYGFELSRYSGSWVGFKFVTNVADEFSTAVISPNRIQIVQPEFVYHGKPWAPTQNPALLAPYSLNQEREILEGRLEAAKLFAAANRLNRITVPTGDAWLGIVAAGKTYYDVCEVLYQFGLDEAGLERHGIRLLKIGMLYPMEPTIVRHFARGLQEILVVEEKRSFVELFIRDVLYNEVERPLIVGKKDENGRFLVPGYSELDADILADVLAQRLRQRLPTAAIDARLAIIHGAKQPITLTVNGGAMPARTPYFCSGCPHNRSTVVPEGSIAGGGIGCHTLAILMDRKMMGITQMGGEGAQWVGASHFSHINHIFQNIGDGTLFHSGSLAIRQAVAAGTNITYKILYNGAVAMTGGQHADGEIPVPELTRFLRAEGVKKVIVCSHDPHKYPDNAQWGDGVDIWERDKLDEAQLLLRDIPGVTALIYDQPCATELRRQRKRGNAPDPEMRVFINEAVCEGCGDCGFKSNCLSVFPVETEFGRKTQIHQSSCNKDYTCLEGDCPAFVTVLPTAKKETKRLEIGDWRLADGQSPISNLQSLPDPVRKVPENANLYLMGIGGTGVVTINQILATAVLLDGKHINSLDQTGLSQKGGPVVSNLKIMTEPLPVSNKIAKGEADAYIVFDVLSGTTADNLAKANKQRTVAVVSGSQIPTGGMVRQTAVLFPQVQLLRQQIESHTRAADNVYLDAITVAENLFGSHMPANIMTIGAAYQAGVIPVRAAAIEQAIELNGVAVEANKQAFRVGRMLVLDPAWEPTQALARVGAQKVEPALTPAAQTLVDSVEAKGELHRLLTIRVPELIAYQNEAYARDYVAGVKRVYEAEQWAVAGETRLSEAVARYLFKLMAYKDEYEVARLHLKPEFAAAVQAQFGEGASVTYKLHPPFLRALGMEKKLSLGSWFTPFLRLLAGMRRLRGTPFDLFGYAAVRRVERELITEYRGLLEQLVLDLTPETHETAVSLATLPDMIRGYEQIKLDHVDRFRREVARVRETAVVMERLGD